jgi:beta-lactamase regulating signal transducer with metallopeptidase domain
VEALLSLVVSNAVVATVLAVAAAVVCWCCRRPVVRHALWLLVLLKLLTPPLIPVPIAWPQENDTLSTPREATADTEHLVAPSAPAEPIDPSPPLEPVADSSDATPSPSPSLIAEWWMPVALAVWLGGSLVWWGVAGLRLARFRRLLRETRAAAPVVQEQAGRLANLLGLRRCPPVVFVPVPLSPMLWALGFSPRLLLPERLWQQLGAQEQDALLLHELAHLRRGDHWVRRLEFVVLGLYWWHPVVWWARRQMQEAEEECCDACVVAALPDAASAYASALVETVTFLSHTRAAAPAGASGAGQVPLLKRRLTMILTATPPGRPSRASFWAVLGLGALLLPMTPGAAQTDPPKRDADPAPQRPADDMQSPESRRVLSTLLGMRLDDPSILDPHRHILHACTECHDNPHRHVKDFLRQPELWRNKHDEAARLLGELRQQRTTLPAAEPVDLERLAREEKAEIEKLQDEIELLKVQVRLKEAHLRVARRQYEAAGRRHALMLEQNKRVPVSVTRDEMREAQLVAENAGDQVQIREAELQEPLVRLKQAERRLAKLQPPTPAKPPVKKQPTQEQRLKELEKKLNEVLEEMKALQGELHPKKPPAGSTSPPR